MDTPWEWLPSRDGWLKMLRLAAEEWVPHPHLRLDSRRVREFLLAAIGAGDDWLYHPCVVALLGGTGRLRKDIQLSLWAASHSSVRLGSINIPESIECWAPVGSKVIPAGVHELAALAYESPRSGLSLDPYSRSLAEAAEESWGALSSISSRHMRTIRSQIMSFLSAAATLESLHPACWRWMIQSVRMAIPLSHSTQERTRSWSSRTHPGAVHLDIYEGEMLILESLVHEAAHCHLYVHEANGPMIATGENGRYVSPLRPDPRPLRGILLAYHALAHICAFYSDAIAIGLGDQPFAVNELSLGRNKLLQVERIVDECESRFTPLGQEFIRNTSMVAQYGNSASLSAA